MFRSQTSGLFIFLVIGILGCSSAPQSAQMATVKGTLNLDGKPVSSAEGHFGVPGSPPSVLTVASGVFSGSAPVGKNKVEVFIYTEESASPKYRDTATKKNIAPAKYWGPNTMLEANVSAGGPNEFKFDITSR